ncbi:MAG: glucosaminidase domain-containing protein [Solobacterium sp.]|nr:glucosaminidase domain-containing protein [Solobacterium sp.]
MKSTFRHFFVLLISLVVLCMYLVPVSAEEETVYYLYDAKSGEILEGFDTFARARTSWTLKKDEYANLSIRAGKKILMAEQAIVLFDQTGCEAVPFINSVDRTENSVNGCYGIDGAYLDTDASGSTVEFMISAVRGWAKTEDISIVPVEEINTRLTVYTVVNGNLYHEIKTQVEDDYYTSIIYLGPAPSYLKNDSRYFSYDGHYFYNDVSLSEMLEDYRKDQRLNSINPNAPYYDYYQFVSHRTISHATAKQAEDWLTAKAGIRGAMTSYRSDEGTGVDDTLSRSQLAGTISAFWQYQYQYGANALMMLAEAAEESAYGRSLSSYNRNNLFSHAAYDNPEEAEASRYSSVIRSIYSHAKYYLSGSYFSPLKTQYHGAFYGNKSSGMNVDYSTDPYWGELYASMYRQIDEQFGSGDLGTETIAVKTSNDAIWIYQEPDPGTQLYRSKSNPDAAFTVTDTIENDYGTWYRILSDATLDENRRVDLSYSYDYAEDIGYIRAEDIGLLLEGSSGLYGEMKTVVYNADSGFFADGSRKASYVIPEVCTETASVPEKPNALFDHWEDIGNRTYKAVYKEVKSVRIANAPKKNYEINERLDLQGGMLEVSFLDGTSERVQITTSMIEKFDTSKEGNYAVRVSYAGCSTSYEISVSGVDESVTEQIYNDIVKLTARYELVRELNDIQTAHIISLKKQIEETSVPRLTQSQLRGFDGIVRRAVNDRIRYIIDENDLNLSVSGLTLAMPFEDSLEKREYFEDTYRIQASRVQDVSAVQTYADMLNMELKEGFTFRILKNYHEVTTDFPMLMTVDKPEGSYPYDVFTVLCYDTKFHEVRRCYTRQSDNQITFMTKGEGVYAVLSRSTSNIYGGDDPVEVLTAENSSYDTEWLRIRLVIAFTAFIILFIFLMAWLRKRSRKQLVVQQETRIEREKDAPLPPVDTTQAMRLFETEVLNLAELMEEEEEENDQ